MLALCATLLSACAPAAPTLDLNAQMTQAVQTAIVSIQQTQTAAVVPVTTEAPPMEATPASIDTAPALGATFNTNLLEGTVIPHTYIQDNCEYLKGKWSSQNSTPGTIVMVVMFHSISKDTASAANECRRSLVRTTSATPTASIPSPWARPSPSRWNASRTV